MRYINRSLENTRHVQFWNFFRRYTHITQAFRYRIIYGGREDDNFFRLTEKEFANRKPKHATIEKQNFESKRQREKITFVSIIPTEKHKKPKQKKSTEIPSALQLMDTSYNLEKGKLDKRKNVLSITRFLFFCPPLNQSEKETPEMLTETQKLTHY